MNVFLLCLFKLNVKRGLEDYHKTFLELGLYLHDDNLLLVSVSSTERARQSWRTSQRERLFCRSMPLTLTRAPMEGSHMASCTKTPLCLHSASTQTPVLLQHHSHTTCLKTSLEQNIRKHLYLIKLGDVKCIYFFYLLIPKTSKQLPPPQKKEKQEKETQHVPEQLQIASFNSVFVFHYCVLQILILMYILK